MNRRELARLGWREHSLAYLEKYLQGYKDSQAYQEPVSYTHLTLPTKA